MLHRAKKRILAAALTLALLLTQTALYARAEIDGPEGNPSDGGGYASSIINPDEQESSGESGPGIGPAGEADKSGPEVIEPNVPEVEGRAGQPPTLGASGPAIAPTSGVLVGSHLTVHLSGKSLEEEVKELALPATVQRLTITGRLTPEDLNYIWTWTGDYDTGSGTTELTGLTRLDLGGAALPGAEVPDYQFCRHSTLNQIVLPVSLHSIGDYAFAGTELTEMDLKEYPSLAGIGAGAFRGIDNLVITLPAQVTLLKTDTFTDCADLRLCLLYNGVVSCETGAFTNAQGFVEVYHGQLSAYTSSSAWKTVNCDLYTFVVVTYLGGEGQGEYTELPISNYNNYLIKSAEKAGISRTGYVSTQWNTQADGSGTSYPSGDQITLQSHMTLYAMWVPDNSIPTVILTLYDDSQTPYTVSLPAGSDYTLGDAAHYSFSDPSGERFQHWNTAQDGTGEVYYPGNVITMDGNRALYGQWTSATGTLTVTYDSNGGTGSGSDTAAYGNPLTIGNGSGISLTGYVLESWNTKPDGSGRRYLPGDTLLVYDDVTLYAQWAPKSGYTVEYRDAGGQLLAASPSLGYGDSYAILDGNELADVTGAFRFWSERPDGGGTRYNPGQEITVAGSLVLYAQCDAIPVTLRLEPNNGDTATTLTTTWPGLYPTLYTPVKWGHIFRGWYDDPTGGSLVESGDAVSNADNRTLYARWEAILALDPLTDDNATVGVAYSRGITARYIGNGSLTYTASGLPGGLDIDAGTGVISGTPAQGAEGSHPVTVSVTDGTYSDTAGFTLTVNPAGQPAPTLTLDPLGDDSVILGDSYAKTLTTTYSGNGTLTYTATGLPDGVSCSAGGLIGGTPSQAGTYPVSVQVTDGSVSDSGSYTLTVTGSGSGGGSSGSSGGGSSGGGASRSSGRSSTPDSFRSGLALSGLPDGPVRVGDHFTLAPNIDTRSGSDGWEWDEAYFSATFNSPATFTALKAGKTKITYTGLTGYTATVEVEILGAQTDAPESAVGSAGTDNPNTGDNFRPTIWLALMAGSLGAAALTVFPRGGKATKWQRRYSHRT